jgi:hypothetical protein
MKTIYLVLSLFLTTNSYSQGLIFIENTEKEILEGMKHVNDYEFVENVINYSKAEKTLKYRNSEKTGNYTTSFVTFYIDLKTDKCGHMIITYDIDELPTTLKAFNNTDKYIKIGNLHYVDVEGKYEYNIYTNEAALGIVIYPLK